MATKSLGEVVFNNKIIPHSQIFLMRKNVFGLINHKPCVQGHVLICSRRIIPKIEDLTEV
jgi:bis(5'-adenosyl)-triphosphatase